MNIKYRVAVHEDKEIINNLFIEMLRSIYKIPEKEKVSGYGDEYMDKYFEDNNNIIYVSVVDDIIVGYLSINAHYEYEENFIYLDDFCVHETFRNLGIGKHFLKMADEYSNTLGINKIILHVEIENKRAIKLYESNGFIVDSFDDSRIKFAKTVR
jgi:Acetyltransferases